MSKKELALSLLLLMLGLASWDVVLDHEGYPQDTSVSEDDEVRKADIDGLPIPK